ncbi:TOMM precursor leader peptide-binding protein [Sorangium atrum]|uniref:TOMM leader peptide-binding protein n=1 Tax=Sorangium atrum TaxID=2995308 RepID=A0ABT5C6K2_9BACT|nr:TOMM precursor leader peptide-binding protein [Sorangium aterium]MDC0681389.1 TOMM precursor leader peptide-binding protein [Sorangium aterium]
MLNRVLRLKEHLRLQLLDDERAFVIGEREQFMLHGRAYALAARLADGRRTVAQIIDALDGQRAQAEVLYALTILEQRGYLIAAAEGGLPEGAAFWRAQGVDPARAAERLAATPVAVHAAGGAEAGPLVEALCDAGVRVDAEAEVEIVVTRDYLHRDIERWNRRALDRKARWALVKPTGTLLWVGPMFGPGGGPCWACVAHRLRENRPVEVYLERRSGVPGPLTAPRAELPSSVRAGAHFASITLARWIADGGAGRIDEHLLTLELPRFACVERPVTRRPQCPVCGDGEMVRRRALSPVVLQSRPKRFTDDGGHRVAPPEDTLARIERHVDALTGAIASAGPIPGRDHPLRPVHGAAYRVCPAGDAPSFDDFHRTSMGKGRTAAQARASALSEAIERYSALFQGDEARVRARFVDLGDAAVHPDALQNYSPAQLRARDATNAGVSDEKRLVPLPFDERAEIDWTPVWSLTHERRRWVPTAYCYQHVPTPPGERFCYVNPNGHAAGNCVEEAVLQAFFELVERDSVALWWYNRARRPAVDLDSFDEPYFRTLSAHYASLGHRIWVLDLTTDLRIPAFAAVSRAADTGRFCVGFGCHFDARLGVQRALTELNQLFDPARSHAAPWEQDALGDGALLLPDATAARRRVDFLQTHHGDLRDDVRACVERAAGAGLETLVLDQTRPDLGLVAVKVVVPGLRHFWPRFGPGRLYDVPVALGWVAAPLAEPELNPVPLYL